MKEKSGIEMISELLMEVKMLRKEIKVLEQNVKKIANATKVSEIATKALETPLKDWVKPSSPSIKSVSGKSIEKKNLRFKFEPVDASKIKQEQPNRSRLKPTMCMCQGKMIVTKDGRAVPLPGLSVKVFDDKDNMIKTTKTNKAGTWMSQLPPGNYIVNIEGKFNNKDLYPVNLPFVVKEGMQNLEVK
jgi:hypothetical protein